MSGMTKEQIAKRDEFDNSVGVSAELTARRAEVNEVKLSSLNVADPAELTYEAAIAALEEMAGTPVKTADPEELGDGFVAVDKEELLNVPLLLLTWEVDAGTQREFGNEFLIVRAIVAGSNRRVRFTCAGYGLYEELLTETKRRKAAGVRGVNAGWKLPKGLDRSRVEGVDGDGKPYANWIYRVHV